MFDLRMKEGNDTAIDPPGATDQPAMGREVPESE